MKKLMRILCLILVLSLFPLSAFAEADEAVSRVEFLTQLSESVQIGSRLYAGSFADVSFGDAYSDLVQGALEAGIIEPAFVRDGNFMPNSPITREEAVALTVKAMVYNLVLFPNPVGLKFTDKNDISPWALPYIEAAAAARLIDNTGAFDPMGSISPAESASLLEYAKSALGELPITVGDNKTDSMLNYVRTFLPGAEGALAETAKENYDDAINRFIQKNSANEVNRAYEEAALAYGAMFPVRDRFMTNVPLYDDNGGLVQAHGGGIIWDEASQKYYWYGEARAASAVPGHLQKYADWGWRIGVACYSSTDLYNWKYEGLALEMLEDSQEAPLEYPQSDIRVGEVIERPKVLYNSSTGKYVMWMHIDNGWYGYSRAGVAVSDSPTGPFEYLGSYRPGDKMSRDMTVYQDDDGASYIYFSTDENSSLAVCRLSDDYLSCEGEATYCIPGGWREAPALFKYKETYYMITSGCTGWDPNEADYATAPSPLGPWTRHGNPCKGDGANLTFGGQSAFILPIDPDKGHFIFIADTWRPSHHSESGFIWLPIQVRGDGSIRIDWLDEWTLEDIGFKVEEPGTMFAVYGEEVKLPEKTNIILDDGNMSSDIYWTEADADYTRPGHYFAEGELSSRISGMASFVPVTAEIYNIPKNLVYFADCGAVNTSEFDVIDSRSSLYNSVPDQAYAPDPATGRSWGYIADHGSGNRDDSNMFSSLRYDYSDGGEKTIGKGLTYKFLVEPGAIYNVYVGVYDPWGDKNRYVDYKIQGYSAGDGVVPASGKTVLAKTGLPVGDGVITVSAVRNEKSLEASLDPVISWIMIVKE